MQTYHSFLVKRLRQSVDIVINCKCSLAEADKHLARINTIGDEIQWNKRRKRAAKRANKFPMYLEYKAQRS